MSVTSLPFALFHSLHLLALFCHSSEIKIWVLILRLFLVDTVGGPLLSVLPLGHEVAHYHNHGNVVVRLLWHHLLLHQHHIWLLQLVMQRIGGTTHDLRRRDALGLHHSLFLNLTLNKNVAAVEV